MEDDPLNNVFDLMVLGTGCVEAMVAAAAANSGKSVVHVDANDFYGSTDASLPLQQIHTLLKSTDAQGNAILAATPAEMPSTLAIEKEISTSELHAGVLSRISTHHIDDLPPELHSAARRITIDLLPRLTFSRGLLTAALVDSGVANYVEYKPLEGAYIVRSTPSNSANGKSASASASLAGTADQQLAPTWSVRRVPASKSDVFDNKELSLLDKRRLMKFLLFAQDAIVRDEGPVPSPSSPAGASSSPYGQPGVGSDSPMPLPDASASNTGAGPVDLASPGSGGNVDRLNERLLGAGRSLLRPQNKATPAFDIQKFMGKPFAEFLQHAGITGILQNMIMFAVGFVESAANAACVAGGKSEIDSAVAAVTTAEGMRRVQAYINSLGRFGTTAFILNLYGSGEIPQAFCRLAAVNGAIYMLRTQPVAWLVGRHVHSPAGAAAVTAATPSETAATLHDAATRSEHCEPSSTNEAAANGASKPSIPAAPQPSAAAADEVSPAQDASPCVVGIRTDSGFVLRCRQVLTTSEYLPRSWSSSFNSSMSTPPDANGAGAGGVTDDAASGKDTVLVAACVTRGSLVLDGMEALPSVTNSASSSADAGDDHPAASSGSNGAGAAAGSSSASASMPELIHLVIPPHSAPTNFASAVYVMQQGPSNNITPPNSSSNGPPSPDLHVVHFYTRQTAPGNGSTSDVTSARAAIERTIDHLLHRPHLGTTSGDDASSATSTASSGAGSMLQQPKPQLLWHAIYGIKSQDVRRAAESERVMSNVIVSGGGQPAGKPGGSTGIGSAIGSSLIHFDDAAAAAYALFRRLYPDPSVPYFPPKKEEAGEDGADGAAASALD